jgi:hypothetical protein
MIEDADAEVRHADLVGVGEQKADLCPYGAEIFVHRVDLGIDVPGRLADEREKVFVQGKLLQTQRA